jgi:hypothetical protein
MVKVTRVETLRLGEFPNLIWVRVHTDEGVSGLGETFFGAEAVEAYIHESVAPYLLGKNPLQIDKHARALTPYVGYRAAGVEGRGNSAIDIARPGGIDQRLSIAPRPRGKNDQPVHACCRTGLWATSRRSCLPGHAIRSAAA